MGVAGHASGAWSGQGWMPLKGPLKSLSKSSAMSVGARSVELFAAGGASAAAGRSAAAAAGAADAASNSGGVTGWEAMPAGWPWGPGGTAGGAGCAALLADRFLMSAMCSLRFFSGGSGSSYDCACCWPGPALGSCAGPCCP